VASVLLVVALASLGSACRQDMHQAPRYDPLEQSDFFADQRASRPLVEHTVARGFLRDDTVFYTGKVNGQPVDDLPAAALAAFDGSLEKMVLRGQERYNIFCSPCHGATGDGNGMVVQRGYKQPSSYHIDRLRAQPLGYFYDVITIGFATMPDYAAQVAPPDRWAIASYIRTLQYSRNAPLSDVPAADRTRLDGDTAPAPAPAAAPAHGGPTSHE
jgi:mono/diheme cytochrome c family protein